ncbi:MAG: M23 family metallopeptidase [Tannerella sp.]|jgi:murein DD-endopeptidase MepM/ murein hydrolase activator NlpD|nr:M23 family metallopeptidase [Tannerella sp.]
MGLFGTRKKYYKFNDKTLEYERVFPSAKERFFVVLQNLSMGLLIGVVSFFLFLHFLKSPEEILLKKENQLLQTHYEMLSNELDQANNILGDLQQRDEKLYRAIFHADTIPLSMRSAGFAGAKKYDYLKGMNNSEIVRKTTQKMDLLRNQLYVQSYSLEELISIGKDMENRLQCLPAIQPVANKDLKRTASGYGMRMDPIYHIPMFHSGMDFTAEPGTDIYATGNGTVVYAEWKQGYGNCIILNHGYDFETLYGHLQDYKVKVGQKVTRGEVIATVGNTGKSTGPHLHYEVWYKGQADNPAKYYYQDLTPEEYDRMLQIAENHGQVMD